MREALEIGTLVVTVLLAFLALRFNNQALQVKIDMKDLTEGLQKDFSAKFTTLSQDMARLRIELERLDISAKLAAIERRVLMLEKDMHWARNMFSALLSVTVADEEKRDALISKVDRHIAQRWEGRE